MAIRASAPGQGVSPFQIRAHVLHRRQPADCVELGAAFPPMTEAAPALHGSERRKGWKQADLRRALTAAEQVGLANYRVEIAPDGTITLIVGDPAATAPP